MYYSNRNKLLFVISIGAAAIIGLITTMIISASHGGYAQITYSDSEHSATITLGTQDLPAGDKDGSIGDEVPSEGIATVEEVDSGKRHTGMTEEEESKASCPEGEECGRGKFIYAPTEDPSAFKNYVFGQCLNSDDAYGAQCWDLADVFWQNTTSRRANTCGTGAAKGMIADGCWQKNAGSDFIMVWDPTHLQYGDWIITNNGLYGHVAMVVGAYNDGYVTVLGQNQGGNNCDGGGAAANIINLNMKNFAGAFRYIPYEEQRIEREKAAEKKEELATGESYTVKVGDTLGEIARKMGWYEGEELFGDTGYTQKLAEANGIANRGLIYPGQVIYAL